LAIPQKGEAADFHVRRLNSILPWQKLFRNKARSRDRRRFVGFA
jgi:hypothetical protein